MTLSLGQLGDKTRMAFDWVVSNEGLSPGAAISTTALANILKLGLAEPNQRFGRRLQDDHWWLTEAGEALSRSKDYRKGN